LMLWALHSGQVAGVLSGRLFGTAVQLTGDRFPIIRASTIGEPGGKCRTVTTSEAWVTLLLQPFAHVLGEYMKRHPSARVGFSRHRPIRSSLLLLSKKPHVC